ncbi:hypothetical protein Bcp1_137 [Bacillus phage Bcp1]|uniref:Uncharacterized protein n=3 Tax=Caeruleovirus TaxID=1911929 RepID=A0A0S2MUH9_9CAUD|nr:hypothetical protein Bcp1_137 [Bacillus phage Bcp1]YP_009626698.1 hypothetical protein FD732_gp196 [Bacillus phage BM15]AXQ66904.1 recombination protein [Bacillus phage Hobo]AXQ67803.1 recombination protein [Bacillus phage Kioshi]AHN66612.1 hypothetical protein Bcp1_137 [Bacillus phage Bcp1]ALO79553.1 hypothetical protein BM10_149 [Bacillus phage BM15]
MLDIKVDSIDFQELRIIDENGEYVMYDMREELKVNEANLLQEMLHQPSKYIYWSSILEKIKFFQEKTEMQLELVVAKFDSEAREEIKKNGDKPTKDSVDAYIKQKEEYVSAREQCHYYEYIAGRLARIVKAFEQRKDMLQSYGKQIAEDKTYGAGAGSRIEQTPFPAPTQQTQYWGGHQ